MLRNSARFEQAIAFPLATDFPVLDPVNRFGDTPARDANLSSRPCRTALRRNGKWSNHLYAAAAGCVTVGKSGLHRHAPSLVTLMVLNFSPRPGGGVLPLGLRGNARLTLPPDVESPIHHPHFAYSTMAFFKRGLELTTSRPVQWECLAGFSKHNERVHYRVTIR